MESEMKQKITIRNFKGAHGFSDDFYLICEFLIRINNQRVITPHYLWARWVWQYCSCMDAEILSHIGMVQDCGKLVGLAVCSENEKRIYFCVDEEYCEVKSNLIDYVLEKSRCHHEIKIVIPNGDLELQQAAADRRFIPTNERMSTMKINTVDYDNILPEGCSVMCSEDVDFGQINYCHAIRKCIENICHQKGTKEHFIEKEVRKELLNQNIIMRIMVASPTGEYVSSCVIWHLPGSDYAYAEPLMLLDNRGTKLCRAAVMEGIGYCFKRGVKNVFVISKQQFYRNIGFCPVQNETLWIYHK